MRRLVLVGLLAVGAAGCGGDQTVMPKGELTDEQKAKVKQEQATVDDEESGGNYGKQFKKGGKK